MSLVIETDAAGIRVIELNHPSRHNPFNERLENDVKAALGRANDDPGVRGVVVTGRAGKSFSAGGDFNEVKNLTGGEDVDRWIDRVTDLYVAALKVDKPMVAAIDGYAIGIGFQFSMMFDWRIMTDGAEFRMPELKHGIGCSMGAAILEHVFSYNVTQDIIYACEPIGPEKALDYRLVREVVRREDLVPRAIGIATMLADYPVTPFRNTKRGLVKGLMETLHRTAEHSKQVHRASFAAKSSQRHFKNILGEKYNLEMLADLAV
ncbi:enoyl-CoA hydratase/isomerase family protein [Azospirillum sp. sgz302134]